MTRRTGWRIRWTGAAAAMAALTLLLLLPLAALGQGLPSGPALPTLPPGTTPTPSPCASPAASPSPSPSASPSPSGCPTPSPTPAPGGKPAGSPAQGSPAASPTPGPGAVVLLPSGTGALITDPALVKVLDSVLAQPVHLQPPSLRHFLESGGPGGGANADGSPPAPGAGAAVSGGHGGGGAIAVVPAALLTAFALGAALAVLLLASWPLLVASFAAMLRVRLHRPPAPRRALHVALGVSACGAVALVMALAPTTGPRGGARAASAAATRVGSAAASVAAAVHPLAGTSPWSQLVAIEVGVAARQQQLALEENRIAVLASSATDHLEPPARGSGADRRIATAEELDALLAAHAQTVQVYQQSLQREYDFYVSAAQNPAVRSAVATAASDDPKVASVVAYDLEQVSTQLEQEQAIAAAQAAEAAQAQKEIAANASAPSFTAPVGGVVSQGFGPTTFPMEPSLTYHGVFYTHFHTGIDIANALDTPVAAAAPGKVILAGTSRDASGNVVGYGNYVVIDHGGGWITLYGHLDKLVVTTGQLVQRGQEIGLLGSTGWSTGPHVHFEIRHGSDFIDPETLLGNAVRQ